MPDEPDLSDDLLDGCEIDFAAEQQATDVEVELMPLFADALDPSTATTVEETAAKWQQLAGVQGEQWRGDREDP